LHALKEEFVEDGGDDPVAAHGVDEKIAAWRQFRRWVKRDDRGRAEEWWEGRSRRNLGREEEDIVIIRGKADFSDRCVIDNVKFRSERADHFKNVHTVGSYLLARVEEDGQEWLEVGRATSFFKHMPPGPATDKKIDFARVKWLVPMLPRLTERSKLPMVVLDNDDRWYLQDRDAVDGLTTSIWPATAILATEACLLPLDPAHDVPAGVKVQAASISTSLASEGLRQYTRRGVDGVDPCVGVRDGFKLAAVITPWCHVSNKFKRPGDLVDPSGTEETDPQRDHAEHGGPSESESRVRVAVVTSNAQARRERRRRPAHEPPTDM
jgi:hypothetical protein